MTTALKTFVLILMLATGSARMAAAETIYFLVGLPPGRGGWPDSYVLPLSKPEDIDYARQLISWGQQGLLGGPRPIDWASPIVVANVVCGRDGINRNYIDTKFPEWSWHVPEFIAFAQITAEILDGSPTMLETSYDWSHCGPGKALIGFWSYTVVRELGPAPLCLSITPQSENFELYWSAPGTNYVFTLETSESSATPNWFAIPGAFWPLNTNHWTLPKTNASARFFRVRAKLSTPGAPSVSRSTLPCSHRGALTKAPGLEFW